MRSLQPWHIVLAFLGVYLGIVLVARDGDPFAFVLLGHGPNEGYDGQFTYLIAINPSPAAVVHEIENVRHDVPAYRYQRILLPIVARLAGLGNVDAIVWMLPLINLTAHVAGTAVVTRLLAALGVSRWHALIYGLWPGLVLGVRANLTEPLSYALVAGGLAWHIRRAPWRAAACLGLAVFARETASLFVAALLVSSFVRREWTAVRAIFVCVVLPFAVWQAVLMLWFSHFGLGSGGYLATGFEPVPFNGLWRIARDSPALFVVYGVLFVPAVVVPSVWGLIAAVRALRPTLWHPYVCALGVNAFMLPFTPFSTFREPGALLRLSTGLVICTLLYAGLVKSERVLRLSWFWLTLLVFLR